MSFSELKKEVERGLQGKNEGLPMGFDRLNRYIGLRKGMYYLTGGLTGSGKTSFIDDAFVLNPAEWKLSKEGQKSDMKLKVIYRSMERSRKYKMAKWTCRKIFIEEGIIIQLGSLLGWRGYPKLTHTEHDIFLSFEERMEQILDIVTIIDGPENPIGIAKGLKTHAEARGTIEQLDKFNKMYVPDDPNEFTIVVIDHVGLLKPVTGFTSKKERIDKMSDELRYARDFYGYSPVVVQQLNRDISNPIRLKAGDVEPQLEDFKDSSQTQDDADVVMALFDPMRYKVADPSGYSLSKLKDEHGANHFRSLRLIKNSFGEDDIRIGLGFFGQVGIFKELPKKQIITEDDYASVLTKQFFLK